MLKMKIDENFDVKELAEILAKQCRGEPEFNCPVISCPFYPMVCGNVKAEMWSDCFYTLPTEPEIEEQE